MGAGDGCCYYRHHTKQAMFSSTEAEDAKPDKESRQICPDCKVKLGDAPGDWKNVVAWFKKKHCITIKQTKANICMSCFAKASRAKDFEAFQEKKLTETRLNPAQYKLLGFHNVHWKDNA